MKPTRFIIYASLVIGIGTVAIWAIIDNYYDRVEEKNTRVVMYKNPGCQCCTKWAEHMEQNGFSVKEYPTDRMPAVKADLGISYDLQSCHTALIGDYVVEGHVPAADVKRLLNEKPDAKGLAVPGMPIGSPGMEGPNPESYEVYLFGGSSGTVSVYARH